MKVLVLGAGRTGASVARKLASEGNDVVVVDVKPALLRELQDQVDIATVAGMAVHPEILESADAANADLLIAVMPRDEDNMLVCQIAWCLYKLPLKIARVRDVDYQSHQELFGPNGLNIDVVINPELMVTQYIQRLIEYPGTKVVRDFADGIVRLVQVAVHPQSRAVGKSIRELHLECPDVRFVAIFRDDMLHLPSGDALIQADDQVVFVSDRERVMPTIKTLYQLERPYKRIIIAGGGHIGKRVALALQDRYQIKIIERDPERGAKIAPLLKKTMVLSGDCNDGTLLQNESVGDCDVFLAVTSEDEANILSCMLAKRLGARSTMCLVNKSIYVEMMRGGPIDIAFSPDKITAASILRYVRQGDVLQVFPVHPSGAEAVETVAHGEPEDSGPVGRRIDQIKLPEGVILGAIVRDGVAISIHHDTVIENGDRVIMFLKNYSLVSAVERLFQKTE